ncbi:proteinase [Aspergillus sclerotioniger CBS 115572]|uniref:Proteinase n=1 Tax=Aspergillus sclerotioniger CBS 115572 TaxID=1450535 RepID=A0A317WXA0_9EURO|nr:proteinase [Aspergillus sclerotioniger CBS 115572]PWY90521.1 proteinase [Aspergillus sclerotioniger CBS 115572]
MAPPDSKVSGQQPNLRALSARPQHFKERVIRFFILLTLAAFAISQLYVNFYKSKTIGRQLPEPFSDDTPFKWEDITPTKQLIYHPCFEGHECARLELPMDWNRTDGKGSKIALAVMKIPAKVPVTDARYGGAVLLNPGGPGGSGVDFVFRWGKAIQTIVDSAESPSANSAVGKYFDIVSFDPRGINNTTPNFSCYPDPMARKAWTLQSDAEGLLGSSERAFDTRWARFEAYGMSCSQLGAEDSEGEEWIGPFMNTSPVVADMVELIERHGEWRERETERLLSTIIDASLNFEAIRMQNRWNKGQEKLLYWGFSYGTLLGSTFAAMQPHRISRAVIDGVCNADDYYSGMWLTNLQDGDAALGSFFEYCHTAGPSSCPFAHGGGSPKDLRSRYEQILANLTSDPIAVAPSRSRGPDIITSSDLTSLVVESLYSPMKLFEFVARVLADLERGNGTSFADYKYNTKRWTGRSSCDPSSKNCKLPGESDWEAGRNVICTDAPGIDGIAKDVFRSYWHTLRGQSKAIGDMWAEIRMSCIRLKTRPEWRYDGPFIGNTSHPLLFIGNTYDPVTPLRNAHAMARGFVDSIVLKQNSVGHCSLSSPSLCTAKAIRRYFHNGELPDPGTVCEVEELPFHIPVNEKQQVMTPDDTALMSALHSLGEVRNLLGA